MRKEAVELAELSHLVGNFMYIIKHEEASWLGDSRTRIYRKQMELTSIAVQNFVKLVVTELAPIPISSVNSVVAVECFLFLN